MCRWGDVASASYGTLNNYQFMRTNSKSLKKKKKALESWGEKLESQTDVKNVFIKYCQGYLPFMKYNNEY